MCSWSSGSRGKKLVSLATISKVNTVNSEEEPCLTAQNYYCDEDVLQDVQMEEFIPITKSCVIDNGSMTIRYMDSADTVVDGQANVEVEEKNIQNMEDDSRGDENRREPMKNDANQIIEETEIVEEENETKGYEEADPYETVEGHTKKGEERKRKKYKLSKEVRAETKKNKVISLHKVREGCINCKLKCRTFFTEEERNTTNHEFWKLDWKGKRTFVMNSTENRTPKRKVEGSKKNKTFTYFLKDSSGTTRRVCKIFFLTTLGYKKTNDWIIHSVWANANSKNQLQNDLDRRGRHPPPNKLSNKIIESHIDSFNPSVSHYRRVHAPNRLYLPSDLNVTLMFEDYKKRYPDYICSYEKYRKILKAKNISFAKLGNEECELCESYHMHNSEHKAESLSDDCEMPPKHKKWNPNDMIKAIEAVKNKEMGYLKAAKVFGVPKGTVERYVRSVLLVLDGHYSHTRNIDLLDLAKQNTVSPYAISSIFCKAYNRAATMETSCNGFRKTGLVPINRNIFRDSDFSVHWVEDRIDTVDPCEVDHQGDDTAQQIHENAATSADFTGDNLVNQDASTSIANEIASITNFVDTVEFRVQQRTPSPNLEQQIQFKLVSPTDICPLPSYKKQNTVSRRSGKAVVITHTPYKIELQASLEKRQMKAIPKKKLDANLNQNSISTQNQPSTSGANRSINQNQPSTSSAKRSKRIRIPSHSNSSSESSGSLKLDDLSSDESGGSDAECLFCTGRFSEDKKGEKWA
ncbi:unnamed protein product [Acanthoscelides obtectus]|uniref:HTH psq-type domain-containing protein n=1 Tax=Acanthoscelides obtectus TaxID=200917 RepID=A0A9P0LUT8_ACAOB|nr:unnamed protein product [Acanthoscelides obtectus]CAK1671379.1 hypothetical protein AOBTE_LOCUS28241 [Acanthoscelides obtectus]